MRHRSMMVTNMMATKKSIPPKAARDLRSISRELFEQLADGPMTAETIQEATMALKNALIERALGAELDVHLGCPSGAERPAEMSKQRNAKTGKTVLTDDGRLGLDTPRDRNGGVAPILIPMHARRFTGFDDKIIAMYARGMSVSEIRAFLAVWHVDAAGLLQGSREGLGPG